MLSQHAGTAVYDRLGTLFAFVAEECERRLRAYEAQPRDANEHYETEIEVLSGGYAYRQLFELVQNAADAIGEAGASSGRIHVVLEPNRLVAANTGAPLDEGGIVALLNARSSSKRAGQIGRFGIGFKSLLKLGGVVEIISRSVGLRFDPVWCRQKIRDRLKLANASRAPGMRLALPLDPNAHNSPLRTGSSFDWATTVVTAAIQDAELRERLVAEMAAFPVEFVLFLDADVELVLDVEGGPRRTIARRRYGDALVLSDGQTESRWRLFQRKVRIEDEAARDDALHLQARDEVPLAWAVPVGGREAAGQFWAFFPTQSQTLAVGILNAPWKLNSDRTNVIQGAWNAALMAAAARLIADHIGELATPEDPGVPVSALPRQLERQDELAASLVKPLWDLLVQRPIVANGDGRLCCAADLARHPVEDAEILRRWRNLAGNDRARVIVHPACQSGRLRAARLDALARETAARSADGTSILPKLDQASWLETAASTDPAAAIALLELVGHAVDKKLLSQSDVQAAVIVPTEGGELAAAARTIIAPMDRVPAGLLPVASVVASHDGARATLMRVLRVREMTADLWGEILSDVLEAAAQGTDADCWLHFWSNFAEAPEEAVATFVEDLDHKLLRFRNREGAFRARDELVAPLPEEMEAVPAALTLDREFHAVHAPRLPAVLLDRLPPCVCSQLGEPSGLSASVVEEYFGHVKTKGWQRLAGNPQWGKTGVLTKHAIQMPTGWRLLPHVPDSIAADLAAAFVRAMSRSAWATDAKARGEANIFPPIHFGHLTRRDAYDVFTAAHPLLSLLEQYGKVRVGASILPLSALPPEAVGALALVEPQGASVVRAFLDGLAAPVQIPAVLHSPLPNGTAAAPMWSAVFAACAMAKQNFDKLWPVWERAAADGAVPALVPTTEGPVPISGIFISVAGEEAHSGTEDGRVVVLSQSTASVWVTAGAHLIVDHTLTDYDDANGEPVAITDMFPELGILFKSSAPLPDALWVFGLAELSGHVSREPAVARDATGVILVDRERMTALSWSEQMQTLAKALHAFGLLATSPTAALAALTATRSAGARALVRAEPTTAQRLLRAIGGDVATLIAILPQPVVQALGGAAVPVEVAKLAIAVHGPSLLSRLRRAMAAQGLSPPERWGGDAARSFVAELGFPPEYGSSAGVRRQPELVVAGPIPLPPLHDYQRDIMRSLAGLISSGAGRRRAVVSLPTGGGKTRVAAEAVVRLVLNVGEIRTALWVAQTDELCEQAVQCFRELWANVGTAGEDLRVVRLWGGQTLPRAPAPGEPVVAVASIQTLNARFDLQPLDWLSRPGIVVIDECHHAIAPSYTSLLRWLDIEIGSEVAREREPPVIGLSATPWRGRDEDESARLAARFDRRWFPSDQAGLHDELRHRGVLAEMKYLPVAYDRPVELTQAEIRHFDQYGELPETVIERIGADPERNEKILKHVLTSDASAILLFANSVAHAQYIAARLHLAGCPAAAVSSQTDRLARQHFVRWFREGTLRVLCNHSVLTTGFDAPRADMILISRPVFSPVRYMQMVGRGLRGPANGGTERCTIATVEDNLVNYRNRLAYHYCRRFFGEVPVEAGSATV